MIKNLFKLNIILIILSLTFLTLSCNDDSSEDENENINENKKEEPTNEKEEPTNEKEEPMNLSEKENKDLLGEIVNYGGDYYGYYNEGYNYKTTLSVILTFEKNNQIKVKIDEYYNSVKAIYLEVDATISKLTPINDKNEYTITINPTNVKITVLSQDAAKIDPDFENLPVGKTKDITESYKTLEWNGIISNYPNKNLITLETDDKFIFFTYHQ